MRLNRFGNSRRGIAADIGKQLHLESLESRQLMAADLVGLSPLDDATGVVPGADIVMTFGEDVMPGAGTGNVVIRNAVDGSLIEAINVNSDRVDFAGATVTVNPVVELPANANIMVQIDAGAVRDVAPEVSNMTIFSEDFEGIALKNSLLVPQFNNYAVTMTGILDVQVAGEYTFGVNNDDGAQLAIDLAQDGVDLIGDEIIYDDSTHGRQDRLSTCAFDAVDTLQVCEGQGDDAISLAVGQYEFMYVYFDAGGGSGGEFFYAPGKHEAWVADTFSLVGDNSRGIGLVDGVTVTTYKEVPGVSVGSLSAAESLISDPSLAIDTEKLALADLAENPGGRFAIDYEIPGAAEWALENDPNPFDWSDEAPLGWSRDNSYLEANRPGGQPEYNGWTFLDKEFWVTEQGDQSRTQFTSGEGTVAVVDPDAYDDFVGINSDNGDNATDCPADLASRTAGGLCGYFSAAMSTPKVYLNGVAENSAVLKFDSSWRDETTQSAEAVVEYFAADGTTLGTEVLFRWESIQGGDNYKPQVDEDGNDAVNEEVTIDLQNPAAATSMIVSFSMPYAQNDWWWSIDNIVITADVAGTAFAGISDDSWTFSTGDGGGTGGGIAGDIDGDGSVAFADFLLLSSAFGSNVDPPGSGSDIDGDGSVGFGDFLILSANFGQSAAAVDAILADGDFLS